MRRKGRCVMDPQAALYARVSSEQQATAHTIASQLAALHERVAADGLTLLDDLSFIDEGYSGATLIRPALERLRDAAAAGDVDRLYVHSPDRLARKYAYQALLLDEFQRAGVEVVFLNRALSQSPEDDLLLQVQGMVAEYERYADIGIALVMPSARLCRAERETWGKMGFLGRSNRHNRSPLDRHRPSRKASRLSEGL
jgi:predicted site-specific integrase-resolvase